MREVKEKSPLKERAAETLKSAPQAAFHRGADTAFQQLRQELCDAAQDGQPEDRYESGKITDTADHAVRQVSHLAEKAVRKLPKTKSEPQREVKTESVPQHERPRQSTAVPRDYPPVTAQPNYPPQSQPQVNRSVRESASPIREKPVSPASTQQPKTREYTPDVKAPASPPQYPFPQAYENVKTVSAETIAPTTGGTEKHEQPAHHLRTERAVRESASPIKEKAVSPANVSQPKMREYVPNADVPVRQPQHPALQIHEKPQPVHQSQTNRSVRELEKSAREKPAGKVKPAEQRPLAQASSSAEPIAPATALTVPPAARTLPREKLPVSSLREPPAALKPDTTQFALPEIKTKEYVRKKRKKTTSSQGRSERY